MTFIVFFEIKLVSQPNETVDITSLTDGIYILRLNTEGGVYTSRIVKQ